MSDRTTFKNSTKHQEIIVPVEEGNISRNLLNEDVSVNTQKQKLPELSEVKSSEINLDAFRRVSDTEESKTFTLKRSLQKFDKIFLAARFMEEDTESKSPLFQKVESSYKEFMDKTSEKGASKNGKIYIREFLLFREAVVKYLEKNGGVKITSKGRRRRDNMRKLLDQINAIDDIPGVKEIPTAESFSLYTDYMGKDGLTNLEKDYSKAHTKLTEKGFLDENDNIKLIDVDKDEDNVKQIIREGSFDDRYITYLKLSYTAEVESRYFQLSGIDNRTKTGTKSLKLINDMLGVISDEEYIKKHAGQHNSIRTPMIEHSQRVLKEAFYENLKKLGVTEKEASKEEAQIAFLMTLSTKDAQIAYQFLSDSTIFMGTNYGIEAGINIPILEDKPEFRSMVKVGSEMEGFNRDRVAALKEKFIATLYKNPEHELADKMREALYNEEKSFLPTFNEAVNLGYIDDVHLTEGEFEAYFNKYMVRNFVEIEEGNLRHEEIVREQQAANRNEVGDDPFAPEYDKFEEILKYESFLTELEIPSRYNILPLFGAYTEKISSLENRSDKSSYAKERADLQEALSDYLETIIWTSDKETRKTMTSLLAKINNA